jgi:transposase
MKETCPYDLVIGLDRSDRKADLHFLEPATGQQWSQTVATQPEALHDWLAQLRQQFPQAKVGLCVEQPAGAILPFLEAYAWITLHAINPLTLQKYREAFVTSRAKDDAKDARYLAELLWHHHAALPVWQPEDSATRKLQLLVSHRRAVVDERTGLTNRLQALLKQYFPQALELCGEELWRPLATAFLRRWPTLQQVQKLKPGALTQFYYRHGSRSEQAIERRLALLEKAVPLTDEPALLESYTLRVQLIGRELQLVVAAIKEYDRQLAAAFAAHPDREIFRNLPGAGPALAPRLLASVGSQRERFASAAALQHYSGIAPVTKQSGGKRHVHRRYLCPKFQRQTFHEFAGESILHSRWAAAYYQQQREKGVPHHTAVRALAFKWQRIIFRLWQDRSVYREETYEAALQRNGSALVARLEHIELGKSPFKSAPKKN